MAKDIDITNDANRVAAAAAMGSLTVLRRFVKKKCHLRWRISPAVGRPLSAAAYTGQLIVVKQLVEDDIRDYDSYSYLPQVSPHHHSRMQCAPRLSGNTTR